MEYTTLSDAEKLMIAQESLRARESEHFQLSLVPGTPGGQQRMNVLEKETDDLRKVIKKLEDGGAEIPVVEPPKGEEEPKAATKEKAEEPKQKLTSNGKPAGEEDKPKTAPRRRKPAAKKKEE